MWDSCLHPDVAMLDTPHSHGLDASFRRLDGLLPSPNTIIPVTPASSVFLSSHIVSSSQAPKVTTHQSLSQSIRRVPVFLEAFTVSDSLLGALEVSKAPGDANVPIDSSPSSPRPLPTFGTALTRAFAHDQQHQPQRAMVILSSFA